MTNMGEGEAAFLSVGLDTSEDMDIVDCLDRVLDTSRTIPDSSDEDLGLLGTSLLGYILLLLIDWSECDDSLLSDSLLLL